MLLVYLHGFLSSPHSKKAQLLGEWLGKNRPDIEYVCPALSAYPLETKKILLEITERRQGEQMSCMGSSLGGFWATWLVEQFGHCAVLINPAVKPSMLLPEYLGVELKSYHTDDTYTLGEKDVEELLSVDVASISRPENYWLMIQTGDETLDYRLATQKYSKCRQLVEEGGTHSFENFERWIPAAVDFLEGT